jgi:regulator of sigma E protease
MDALTALFAFVVVLIPLIVVHEFGHLLACKSVGIAVLEFGIGFPPRVARLFRWGETDFTLNALPLGGFVLPLGEDFVKPQGEEATAADRDEVLERLGQNPDVKSVHEAKPWQKIWFLGAGALANFAAALVLFVIVPLTGVPARQFEVRDVLDPASPLQVGDIIFENEGAFFNARDSRAGHILATFGAQDPVTVSLERGEKRQTVDLSPLNAEAEAVYELLEVEAVQPDLPADRAGLLVGDRILAVDGEAVRSLRQLQDYTAGHQDQEIALLIQRAGEELTLSLVPTVPEGESRARMGVIINRLVAAPRLGLILDDSEAYRPLGFSDSLTYGVEGFLETFVIISSFPSRLLRGELTAQEARPVSPVGVSQIGAEIIQNNPYQDLILFTALISIALGITNLLPIPGLDGGRILFVLVEIVRGKPMAPEREGLVHLMGFAFLLVLSIILIINDLVNPLSLN